MKKSFLYLLNDNLNLIRKINRNPIILEKTIKQLLKEQSTSSRLSVNDFLNLFNDNEIPYKNSIKTFLNSVKIDNTLLLNIISYINHKKKTPFQNFSKNLKNNVEKYLQSNHITKQVLMTLYLKDGYNRNDVKNQIISFLKNNNRFEQVPSFVIGTTGGQNTSALLNNVEFIDKKIGLYIKILLKDFNSSKGSGGGTQTEIFDEIMTQLSLWIIYNLNPNIKNDDELNNEIKNLIKNKNEIKKSGIEINKFNKFLLIYNRFGEDKIKQEISNNEYLKRVLVLKSKIKDTKLVKVYSQDDKIFINLFNKLKESGKIPNTMNLSKWNPADIILLFNNPNLLENNSSINNLVDNYDKWINLEEVNGKIFNKYGIYGYSVKKIVNNKVIARGGKVTPKTIIGLFDKDLSSQYNSKLETKILFNVDNEQNKQISEQMINLSKNTILNNFLSYYNLTHKISNLLDELESNKTNSTIINKINKDDFIKTMTFLYPTISNNLKITIDTIIKSLYNYPKEFNQLKDFIVITKPTRQNDLIKVVDKCYNTINNRKDINNNMLNKNLLDIYGKIEYILNGYSNLINNFMNNKNDIVLFESINEFNDLLKFINIVFVNGTSIMKILLNIMINLNVLFVYNEILNKHKNLSFYDIIKENYLYAKSMSQSSMDYIMILDNFKVEIIGKNKFRSLEVKNVKIYLGELKSSMNILVDFKNYKTVNINYRTFKVWNSYTSEIVDG